MDERISAEEVELLEKNQAMKELLKEWRSRETQLLPGVRPLRWQQYIFITEKCTPARKAKWLFCSPDVKLQGRRCPQVVFYLW